MKTFLAFLLITAIIFGMVCAAGGIILGAIALLGEIGAFVGPALVCSLILAGIMVSEM